MHRRTSTPSARIPSAGVQCIAHKAGRGLAKPSCGLEVTLLVSGALA